MGKLHEQVGVDTSSESAIRRTIPMVDPKKQKACFDVGKRVTISAHGNENIQLEMWNKTLTVDIPPVVSDTLVSIANCYCPRNGKVQARLIAASRDRVLCGKAPINNPMVAGFAIGSSGEFACYKALRPKIAPESLPPLQLY